MGLLSLVSAFAISVLTVFFYGSYATNSNLRAAGLVEEQQTQAQLALTGSPLQPPIKQSKIRQGFIIEGRGDQGWPGDETGQITLN